MDRAQAQNSEMRLDFTFHAIKVKAISDYDQGDKQVFSDHKTANQIAVYDRKIEVVGTQD
jgi:hypothetical protein